MREPLGTFRAAPRTAARRLCMAVGGCAGQQPRCPTTQHTEQDKTMNTFSPWMLAAIADLHICPRCSGGVPNHADRGRYVGALSRTDNQTIVCSSCGHNEANEQLAAGEPMPQSEWAVNARPEQVLAAWTTEVNRMIDALDEAEGELDDTDAEVWQ